MTPTIKNLIEQARELESLALAIYTRLAATFKETPELQKFWMSMARHEAGHVGALVLINTLLDQSVAPVELRHDLRVSEEAAETVRRLHAEAAEPLSLDRAFEIAVELEGLEIEDVVLELIDILSDSTARQQAEHMMLHDLSDLSLMIEKHCQDEDLLARADALVESRVGCGDD